MAKYEVTLEESGKYTATWVVEVEAENKDQAYSKAWATPVLTRDIEYDYRCLDQDVYSIYSIKEAN
jgi:hypothetical protein